MFEFAKFEAGTKAVMDAVVEATKNGATTIIGKKNVEVGNLYKLHILSFTAHEIYHVYVKCPSKLNQMCEMEMIYGS